VYNCYWSIHKYVNYTLVKCVWKYLSRIALGFLTNGSPMSSELVCGTYKDSVLQHVRWDSTDYIFALLGCLAAQFLTNVRGLKTMKSSFSMCAPRMTSTWMVFRFWVKSFSPWVSAAIPAIPLSQILWFKWGCSFPIPEWYRNGRSRLWWAYELRCGHAMYS